MTDHDEFETRLRRALHAHADRQVDAAAPLPSMRRPDGRWGGRPPYLLPLLAAAVVVLAAGGTVVAARSVGHPQHAAQSAEPQPSTAAPDSLGLGVTGTADLPSATPSSPHPASTAPSSAPVGTATSTTTTAEPRSTAPTAHPSSASRSTRYVPPPPPSSTPAAPSGPDVPCRGNQLELAVGGDRQVSGNANYNDYDFVYITNSGGTCKLAGYPSVVAYDRSGAVAGGPATHLASPAPTTLVLHHGDQAEIDVYDRYGTGCQGDVQGRLIVTPPGSDSSATLGGWQYSPCNLAVTAFQPARPPEQHT